MAGWINTAIESVISDAGEMLVKEVIRGGVSSLNNLICKFRF